MATRHFDCARRRNLRARETPINTGELALENGEIAQVPSDDEPIPAARGPTRTRPPPLDIIRCNPDPRYTAPIDVALPNAQTLKKPGETLNASSSKGARTSRDTGEHPGEVNLQEYGLPYWDDATLFLGVMQEGRAQAINSPLLG